MGRRRAKAPVRGISLGLMFQNQYGGGLRGSRQLIRPSAGCASGVKTSSAGTPPPPPPKRGRKAHSCFLSGGKAGVSPARAGGPIGIGRSSRLRPSHTTLCTGQYAAARRESSGMSCGDGCEAESVEEPVGPQLRPYINQPPYRWLGGRCRIHLCSAPSLGIALPLPSRQCRLRDGARAPGKWLQQHPRLPSLHLRHAPALLDPPTWRDADRHPPTGEVCRQWGCIHCVPPMAAVLRGRLSALNHGNSCHGVQSGGGRDGSWMTAGGGGGGGSSSASTLRISRISASMWLCRTRRRESSS